MPLMYTEGVTVTGNTCVSSYVFSPVKLQTITSGPYGKVKVILSGLPTLLLLTRKKLKLSHTIKCDIKQLRRLTLSSGK